MLSTVMLLSYQIEWGRTCLGMTVGLTAWQQRHVFCMVDQITPNTEHYRSVAGAGKRCNRDCSGSDEMLRYLDRPH